MFPLLLLKITVKAPRRLGNRNANSIWKQNWVMAFEGEPTARGSGREGVRSWSPGACRERPTQAGHPLPQGRQAGVCKGGHKWDNENPNKITRYIQGVSWLEEGMHLDCWSWSERSKATQPCVIKRSFCHLEDGPGSFLLVNLQPIAAPGKTDLTQRFKKN